ncbi:lysophospholipid acyltransferase family protein [Roseivivax jejudonensis]|nr:lysophospholipid acyltransferase family protein [Roseivivax jejudonensis]
MPTSGHAPDVPYDKRKLSYAGTFESPWKRGTIRTMEWATGKLTLLRMVRRFERIGPAEGQAFWAQALSIMGITLETPAAQIARIPPEGPVVLVANHPHGLVDGMVLAELVGRVRRDYKILTRSLLTGVKEVERFMIPVPFPHEADARAQGLDMRRRAMEHLGGGGLVALFPSGVVAASEKWFGPAIEGPWNPFTANLIQRSGATVLPVHFPGQNSRAYQIANKLSATLRQGLLLHEVVHACHRPQAPVIGTPIRPEEIRERAQSGRDLVAWLRERTLGLGGT